MHFTHLRMRRAFPHMLGWLPFRMQMPESIGEKMLGYVIYTVAMFTALGIYAIKYPTGTSENDNDDCMYHP